MQLGPSESRVYPYQRVGESVWKCDFCESKNSGVQRFRFDVDTPDQPCRELYVCSESECNGMFDSSVQFFNKNEGRVPLQHILRTVPKFFEVSFTVRRSNGDLDDTPQLELCIRVKYFTEIARGTMVACCTF